MDFSRIATVLVEPREPGNIGAAARALANMGLSRLILVNPADHLTSPAYRMALGGKEVLEGAEVCSSLSEALEGCAFVVGTTRRQRNARTEMLDARSAAREITEAARKNSVAVLFGREDRGLTNDEIEQCQRVATIPAARGNPSINLSQAVMVMAYEIFLAGDDEADAARSPVPRVLATREKLEGLYAHMEEVLLMIDYLHGHNPRHMMRVFREIFGRAGLSEREVQALRGIFHQVKWHAGGRPGEGSRGSG